MAEGHEETKEQTKEQTKETCHLPAGMRSWLYHQFEAHLPAGIRSWLYQFEALMWKCGETLFRRPMAFIVVTSTPVVMLLLLSALKTSAFEKEVDAPFPNTFELGSPDPSTGLPRLPKCIVFNTLMRASRMECTNLAYSWSGLPGTETLAKGIAAKLKCSGEDPCAEEFSTPQKLADAIVTKPGRFDASLLVEVADSTGFFYTLWRNKTSESLYKVEESDHFHFAKVQKVIEEAAMLEGFGGIKKKLGAIKATIKKIPETKYSDLAGTVPTGFPNTIESSAGTLMVFGLTISSVFAVHVVAQEKRDDLLGLLRMTGLRESTYWLSWFLSFAISFMFSGFVLGLVGQLVAVELFSKCALGVHMIAAFLFSSATLAFVLIFAAIVKETWAVQLVQFATILFNVLWQSFISQGWFNASEPPQDFWTERSQGNPDFAVWEKIVTFLFPTFHYAKILQNIIDVTGVQGGRSSVASQDPRLSIRPVVDYNWSNIHDPVGWNFGESAGDQVVGFPACFNGPALKSGCKDLVIACTSPTYPLPSCPEGVTCNTKSDCDWVDFRNNRAGSWYGDSVGDSFGYLVANTLIYLLIVWYVAQIFSAGTGSSKPPWFPFSLSYWTGKVEKTAMVDSVSKEQRKSAQDGSARLCKLSKSYKDTTALKELTVAMNSDEVFCLLGHNGAGKTTTINLLTGLHPPTHGEAFVKGLSLRTNVSHIQAIMGVCPQNNVLFDGISGWSHIRFWARFKGMCYKDLRVEATRLLSSVGLLEKASVAATTYSGGMKRRLSVAIASVAAPSIVFLDEPTTGLDPLSRMKTWGAISSLKRGRVVCLTTHSMEEADALADQVGILASGRLRALGTPLFLKSRFGSGYHITLACAEGKSDEVTVLVQGSLPTANIISNVSGYMTVGVPTRVFHLVPAFFAVIESKLAQGCRLVEEWSISATTLEEVFLKVAVEKKAVNADMEGNDDDAEFSQHLYPGLVLSALEGCPVRISMTEEGGATSNLDRVVTMMCSAPPVPIAPPAPITEPETCTVTDLDTTEGPAPQRPVAELGRDVVPDGNANPSSLGTLPAAVPTPRPEDERKENKEKPEANTNMANASANMVLPPPGEATASIPSGLTQIRALLIKSATLQRKTPVANCFRICCVGFLVCFCLLFDLLMSMLMDSALTSGSPEACMGIYTIGDFEITEWIKKENEWNDFQCRKQDLANFILNRKVCELGEAPPIPTPGTNEDYISMVKKLFARPMYESEQRTCVKTFVDKFKPSNAAAWTTSPRCGSLSDKKMSKACHTGKQMPDLCQLKNMNLLALGEVPIYDRGFDMPYLEHIAEEVATLHIWHEGALDASWFGGVGENIFTIQPQDPAWKCGAVRYMLRKIDDVSDISKEIEKSQIEQVRLSVQPRNVQCNLDAIFQLDWFERQRMQINPLRQDQKLVWSSADIATSLNNFRGKLFPDLGLKIGKPNFNDGSLAYDIWVYGVTVPRRANRGDLANEPNYPFMKTLFKDPQAGEDCFVAMQGSTHSNLVHEVVATVHDAFLQKLAVASGISSNPRIASVVMNLPALEFSSYGREVSAFILLLFMPIVSMVFLPVFVSSVQSEYVEKNVLAMQMQSLRLVNYWLATYLLHFAMYFLTTLLFYILALIAGIDALVYCNHALFFVVLLAWGHSQVSMSFFLGTALGNSKMTVVLSYMIIVSTMIAGPILSAQNFGQRWNTPVFLWPPLNFVRGLMLVLLKGPGEMSPDEESEWVEAIILQFVVGTLLFIVSVMIHCLRQGTFDFDDYVKMIIRWKPKAPGSETTPHLDSDVAAEASRVNATDHDFVITVKNIVKQYSGGFRAVQGVSFGINSNECFGLLGPNGAGKTTIISMLSGNTSITDGEGFVDGHSVKNNSKRIHQVLGICPQFDIHWRSLSVYEHLLVFARIKGIPKQQVVGLVKLVAETVGLDGDPFNMASHKLSGGMRRRLSMGIALVANPRVLFLDEPSTGLDPETRQGLWRIISGITPGRSVVLTTHSMEEADALCGRIGIMALGRLRCLGTPLHLKTKFGEGYQLSVSLKSSEIGSTVWSEIEAHIATKINNGKKADSVETFKTACSKTFALPASAKVSNVFDSFTEDAKKQLHIQDWSLNQTSLNQVFLKIAKEFAVSDKGKV